MNHLGIGERIRAERERGGRTQVAVAGLCGITVDYLSQIERGLRVPSLEVLASVARELGVPIASLLGESQKAAPPAVSIDDAVARALLGVPPRGSGAVLSAAQLRDRVEAVWRMWQSSPHRFSEAATVLPALIAEVEAARRACQSPTVGERERRDVLRCAADLYGLLRSYCRRTGRSDLSVMVADRALRAAEEADCPVRIAAAHWNLGHVLLGDGRAEEAEHVARQGADRLSAVTQSHDVVAMRGALELVVALGQTGTRQWWRARRHLEERAAPLALRSGEHNVMWTVFGPTNVLLHQLSLEMEAGETSEALRIADHVDTSNVPSRERRFTFGLHIARCYAMRREDTAVLLHLLDLEQVAPEDLSRSPVARDLVEQLVARSRPTYRPQAVGLAERMGLL